MEPKRLRSTIYHLSNEQKGRGFIGYRYRSLGGFRPRRLKEGVVTRPWISGEQEWGTFPEAFIRHAVLQREEVRRNGGPPLGVSCWRIGSVWRRAGMR
jgi:hypothetical protein